eukprot:GHVP01063109.1.p1 GENE.GHVP01063109.1~~GHVP01063109.1.p1  ORF type:complete len:280 (+),score=52.03 GHVP01063109.1:600-1439(+)
MQMTKDEILDKIRDIQDGNKRESIIKTLSDIKGDLPEIGLWLWETFGATFSLLKEILIGYNYINNGTLSWQDSRRICNALSLLQCIATHEKTTRKFIKAYIPIYLYPLISIEENGRSYRYVRLTGLGVIGSLLRTGDEEALDFFLKTDALPLILNIIHKSPGELSRTISLFILHEVTATKKGHHFIFANKERSEEVVNVLNETVVSQIKAESKNVQTVKTAFKCYHELLRLKINALFVYNNMSKEFLEHAFILELLEEEKIDLEPHFNIKNQLELLKRK